MTAAPEVTVRLSHARAVVALLVVSRGFVSGARGLPGVVRVFPASVGLSRRFSMPVTEFRAEGRSVGATVTIGSRRGRV